MRSILAVLMFLTATPILASAVLIGAWFGVKDRDGGLYDWSPRIWGKLLLWAAGVKVVRHNEERALSGQPRIFVANHVSWYDIFTLAGVLRRYKFVGKAELFRIPLFGRAALAAGMIAIERESRKSAFESYRTAAERIRDGASVVVCPEGTRGETYALRPFKKGPFVLAVAAGVPIVPTLLYGTREILPRDTWWRVRSGTVHVHYLEEIQTLGMSYSHRDELANLCWQRMADALQCEYGIQSEPPPGTRRLLDERPVMMKEA